MMSAVFKGVSMFKRLVVLVCTLLLPAWAQSQGHSGAKAKLSPTSAQVKARASADLTARLQARAIAEAAAQAAAQEAVLNQAFGSPSAPLSNDAASERGVPSSSLAPQPSQAQTSAPIQALPALTEAAPQRSDAPAASLMAVEPVMPTSPAMSAAQPLTPSANGLAVPAPLPPSASDPVSQDLAIAQQIHQGLMPCEMGASVRVQADAAAPGFFHVQGKGFRYRMYPVRTNTGALRLEDKKAGAVWLQLANKSMLMDQKKGRRLADDCAHPEQVAFGQDMKTNPPPGLVGKTGTGKSND